MSVEDNKMREREAKEWCKSMHDLNVSAVTVTA